MVFHLTVVNNEHFGGIEDGRPVLLSWPIWTFAKRVKETSQHLVNIITIVFHIFYFKSCANFFPMWNWTKEKRTDLSGI